VGAFKVGGDLAEMHTGERRGGGRKILLSGREVARVRKESITLT